MATERMALSQRERERWKVLHEVPQKHLSQVAAAERLKVTDRPVRRMLLRIRERGDGALVHGLRRRPSNHKLAALIVLERWRDAGVIPDAFGVVGRVEPPVFNVLDVVAERGDLAEGAHDFKIWADLDDPVIVLIANQRAPIAQAEGARRKGARTS